MPPKPRQPSKRQPPNSSRRVSNSSSAESVDSTVGVDLSTDLKNFLDEDIHQRSRKGREKKIKRLMKKISSKLPEGHPGLDKDDRTQCLNTIKVHIKQRNKMALEFLSLIQERESFEKLRLRVCCFSDLTKEDKLMDPQTLLIHDPIDAGIILSQWSTPTVRSLDFPTPEEYNVVKKVLDIFNTVFDQSSEQSAVIKVAAYSVLLHLRNEHLCIKYFPEFGLFSITPEESAAEVVARVDNSDYRYFLTGRADAFIVSLTKKAETGPSILKGDLKVQRDFSKECAGLVVPKYRPLASRLEEFVRQLSANKKTKFSYEVVVLEVKKLQLPAKIPRMELRNHLKQVIGECAAIQEYGPDQCKFLKFILSDGDRWLFGVLRNPERNEVGFNTERECFYAVLDNSKLDLVEQITEILAIWMTNPGDELYDKFLEISEETAVTPGA